MSDGDEGQGDFASACSTPLTKKERKETVDSMISILLWVDIMGEE